MFGLAAYFDESGHSNDPMCRFVGMGGLCAPAVAWEEFSEKWQAILDEQCEGVPFHMKEFAFGAEHFKGWKKPQRDKLLGDLVRVIKETNARPFGAVVSLDAYDLVCKSITGAEQFLVEPYYLCFQDVTRAAALNVLAYGRLNIRMTFAQWLEYEQNERVAMVYARQKQYGTISSPDGTARESMGRAESLWYAIKDANPHFGKWMGSYASASPEDLNFLQASDLFAYELTHEFENRINRSGDKMRWALAQMLPGSWRDFLHRFYGVPQLLELFLENNRLDVTEDQKNAGLTNSSLSKIMHRDLLFGRMYERRGIDAKISTGS